VHSLLTRQNVTTLEGYLAIMFSSVGMFLDFCGLIYENDELSLTVSDVNYYCLVNLVLN
jgi:hypothetical protein